MSACEVIAGACVGCIDRGLSLPGWTSESSYSDAAGTFDPDGRAQTPAFKERATSDRDAIVRSHDTMIAEQGRGNGGRDSGGWVHTGQHCPRFHSGRPKPTIARRAIRQQARAGQSTAFRARKGGSGMDSAGKTRAPARKVASLPTYLLDLQQTSLGLVADSSKDSIGLVRMRAPGSGTTKSTRALSIHFTKHKIHGWSGAGCQFSS